MSLFPKLLLQSRSISFHYPGAIKCTRLHYLQNHPLFVSVRRQQQYMTMPPKRKRSSVADAALSAGLAGPHETLILPPVSATSIKPPDPKRQASRRSKVDTNPDHNGEILDGKMALRASPDADKAGESLSMEKIKHGAPITPAKRMA
jgi:hypothetical protein